MIEINTWMNGFLKSINEAFGDRVWFVGLQVAMVVAKQPKPAILMLL